MGGARDRLVIPDGPAGGPKSLWQERTNETAKRAAPRGVCCGVPADGGNDPTPNAIPVVGTK